MAKKYGSKHMVRSKGSGIGSLMLAFISFIFGYLISTVFDMNQLSGWLTAQVGGQSAQSVTPKLKKQAELPKPKFEFYTLLTKEKDAQPLPNIPVKSDSNSTRLVESTRSKLSSQAAVSNITSVPAAAIDLTVTQKLPLHEPLVIPNLAQKPVVAVNQANKFVVQLASFKNLHEAEKMRAALMMKGFDVSIATAVQQQVNWYRVVIGPFVSRPHALQAQQALARSEHIVGMIRKLDA